MEGEGPLSYIIPIFLLVGTGLSLYEMFKRKKPSIDKDIATMEGKEDEFEKRAKEVYEEQKRR